MSKRINSICEAFMIHPVIVLRNSSMRVGTLRIGIRRNVWKKYISSELSISNKIDKKLLFITYAGLTKKELKEIKEQVKRWIDFECIICQKASPVISINCGPGTFGLLFILKDE